MRVDLTKVDAGSRSEPPQLLPDDAFSPLRDDFRSHFRWIDDQESIAWRISDWLSDKPVRRILKAETIFLAARDACKAALSDWQGMMDSGPTEDSYAKQAGEHWGAPMLAAVRAAKASKEKAIAAASVVDRVALNVMLNNRTELYDELMDDLSKKRMGLPKRLAAWSNKVGTPFPERGARFETGGKDTDVSALLFRLGWNADFEEAGLIASSRYRLPWDGQDDNRTLAANLATAASATLLAPRGLLAILIMRLAFAEAYWQTRRVQLVMARADAILERGCSGRAPGLASLQRSGCPEGSTLKRIVDQAVEQVRWPQMRHLDTAHRLIESADQLCAGKSNAVTNALLRNLRQRDLLAFYAKIRPQSSTLTFDQKMDALWSARKTLRANGGAVRNAKTIVEYMKTHPDFKDIGPDSVAAALDSRNAKERETANEADRLLGYSKSRK